MGVSQINVAIIGASGYTGADAVRLLAAIPRRDCRARLAMPMPDGTWRKYIRNLSTLMCRRWCAPKMSIGQGIDAAICGLPHSTAQDVIAQIPTHVRIIDMSADFRLRDAEVIAEWYGRTHDNAADLLADAVYGLTEHYRAQIKSRAFGGVPRLLSDRCVDIAVAACAGGLD